MSAESNPRSSAPPQGRHEIDLLVDHCFRHAYGLLTARMSRMLGNHRGVAEDIVQEAMTRALRAWPFTGIPAEPVAWLQRTAWNLAVDHLRSHEVSRSVPLPDNFDAQEPAGRNTSAEIPGGPNDDQLILLFLCCHPRLTLKPRLALTLKAVAGFSVAEIARALLMKETGVAQMITRAKRRVEEAPIPFAFPTDREMGGRLEDVQLVLYLMFNEGYAASCGDELFRRDLSLEAIRLVRRLGAGAATNTPEVDALAALMLAQAARFPARQKAGGEIILLPKQDRGLWDRRMIDAALFHFQRAATGPVLTRYHLEAAIAVAHSTAKSWEATDWTGILETYDLLMEIAPSPVMALNRVVVISQIYGPVFGLQELEKVKGLDLLKNYYLLPATLATIYRDLGRLEKARVYYREAERLASNGPARRFIRASLAEL